MTYCPFRNGCDPADARLYLAELRALVRAIADPTAAQTAQALSRAGNTPDDPNRLTAAHRALEALPATLPRRALAIFAVLRREDPHAR